MPRTSRPKLSEEELRSWFKEQQPLGRLLYGLRALGFSAESIAEITGAPSRDTVYAWTADRSVPTAENAEQLDRLRSVVSWISIQPHLGPGSVWLVLNGWPGGLDSNGPTAIQLLADSADPGNWQRLTRALGMALGDQPGPTSSPSKPASPPPSPTPVPAGGRRRSSDN